jgi:membrane-associated phospholipid phosphatase
MSMRTGRWVIAVWVALVAVGSLLAFAARGAGPLPGDLLLTRLLQGLPPPDSTAGSLLSHLGNAVWFLLGAALAVTLLGRRWLAALLVFLASLTAVLMSVVLKLIVARPRPSTELVQIYDPSESYSFPSTTAFFSVVLLGVIVYLIWRTQPPRPVLIVALGASSLSVLAIGLSRVYVGEHWETDILGGWLFGGAWLLVLVVAHCRWTSRHANLHKNQWVDLMGAEETGHVVH